MIHPYHEMPRVNKKEPTLDIHKNLDGSQGHYAKCKRPISKGHILYDTVYRTSPNDRDGDEINDCSGLQMGILVFHARK